jgi:hypothetical protein
MAAALADWERGVCYVGGPAAALALGRKLARALAALADERPDLYARVSKRRMTIREAFQEATATERGRAAEKGKAKGRMRA